ncbi:hypothetical protein ABUE38_09570 [Pediococcus parvulus]|jgi:hypothetical protein|uniref:Uncharacterized protein n=1 Tax=Pediococcus parvulus TaxID=54062 RepID=A0AAP5TBI7_9LACO|nr:hypothetical protein [Pediococcus parvulus]MCT3031717.1 hypothetical protein [Pediococcus parvulus]MDN5575118.1 hypothetical protein [Pediococcus sp.]MDV7694570.1 hypothetical protein [Pediococcus parvulus]OAD64780.1 hypothetical protein A7K95_03030 [Pediococcus parvulus]
MTTARNGMVTRIGKRVIHFLNYNAKKALNVYMSMLGLLALANVAYISFLANATQVTLREFLDKNPINTVMLIVSTMDVIVAYILWMEKDKLLADQRKFQGIIVYLSVLQLLVGNLLCFVLGMITLVTSKDLPLKGTKYIRNKDVFPLIMGAVIYLFCLFLLLKLAF